MRPLRFGFLFRDGGQVGRRGGDERPRDSGRAAGCAQCRDRQVGLGCRRCRTVPQRYEQLQRIGSEHRYRVQRRGVRRSEIGGRQGRRDHAPVQGEYEDYFAGSESAAYLCD